jgi:hypothetical protein
MSFSFKQGGASFPQSAGFQAIEILEWNTILASTTSRSGGARARLFTSVQKRAAFPRDCARFQVEYQNWLEGIACRPGTLEICVRVQGKHHFVGYIMDAANLRAAFHTSAWGWFYVLGLRSNCSSGEVRVRVRY